MSQTNKEKEGAIAGLELIVIVAILLTVVHFFWFGYHLFQPLPFMLHHVYPILTKFFKTGSLLANPLTGKTVILLLVIVYSGGAKGALDPTLKRQAIVVSGTWGLLLFFGSLFLLYLKKLLGPVVAEGLYVVTTLWGLAMLIKAGQLAGRLLFGTALTDIFNDTNEEFPQNEVYLTNEDSVHFNTQYHFQGAWRQGMVNIVNPYRSTMILGLPGSGKSFAVLIPAIWQSIFKGFTAYVYDYKFPDLTTEAFNAYIRTCEENPWAWTPRDKQGNYLSSTPIVPTFWVINFDDIEYSHRCNPLTPELMVDILDAYEAAQTILYNLNKKWAQSQGDFFPESAINFMTGVIWYLRTVSLQYARLAADYVKLSDHDPARLAQYIRLSHICTFPHVIEFINKKYDYIFPIMEQYIEVEAYVSAFIDAKSGGAMEQLEGQIASVRMPIARLSSPQLYWIMTGEDFTLDISNPRDPKILCTGNNPAREGIYSAAFSLYSSRLMKLVNQKGRLKSALFWDELPTIFLKGIDKLIATARGNRVATWMAVQDYEQLSRDYGVQEAKVIMNLPGNLFAGTVVYETAQKLTQRFGKTNQQKVSMTYSRQDTTVNVSTQSAEVIPASKIATLKQGEFVGQFADNFGDEEVDLKTFKGMFNVEHTHKKHQLPIITDLGPIIERTYGDELNTVVTIGERLQTIRWNQLTSAEQLEIKKGYITAEYPAYILPPDAALLGMPSLPVIGWAFMPTALRSPFLNRFQQQGPEPLAQDPLEQERQLNRFFGAELSHQVTFAEVLATLSYDDLPTAAASRFRYDWIKTHHPSLLPPSMESVPTTLSIGAYATLPDETRKHFKQRLINDHYLSVKEDIKLLITIEFERHNLPPVELPKKKGA